MQLIPSFIRKRIAHRPNLVKIVDNVGWLFFDKVLRMGVGLFVGVWVARYLGPEQFGQLNFAIAFAGLFVTIGALGLPGIVVRDVVNDPGSQQLTLGTAAALQAIGGFLAYGAMLVGICWLRPDDTLAKMLVAIVGAVTLFKVFDVAVYWFESQVQSKYTVWVQNGAFLVIVAAKVALVLLHAPLVAFAWAMFVETALASIVLFFVFSRSIKLQAFHVQLRRAKIMLKDSWPLLLSGLAIMVYMKIDQIMLGQMIGDEAVGVFSAAIKISEIWFFIPMAIVATVFPTILDSKKRSETQYYQRMQHLFDLMVWLSMAIALPMTFLSTPITNLLYGTAYESAGSILAIHIWASVFVFLGVATSNWLLAEGKQISSLQRTLFGAVVNVLLNLILIPDFGALGAAWATVIAQFSVGLLYDLFQRGTRRIFFMKLRAFNPCRLMFVFNKL